MQCVKCGQELPEGVAFCPCCGEQTAGGKQEADSPIYASEVKGWLKSGSLAVYRDRVEFSTSGAQKTVFNYNFLAAVKKRLLPTPAILFITEDGRTECCTVSSKIIHEAFLYVEQAVGPYLEARKVRLRTQGIRYSLVSSMGVVNSGILNLSDDHAQFLSKSGITEVPFRDVKSAAIAGGALEFFLYDGGNRTFTVEKETRDEVLAYVKQALEPFRAQRKADLLARGIYFSFLSSQAQESGTLDIYEDRAEFTGRSGRTAVVSFPDIRTAALYAEMLEFRLVDGTAKAFAVDRDEQDEILAFIRTAIEPYVRRRTEGFDAGFGSAERIEFNPERGVFHIIRQNGAVISGEYPLSGLVKCELTESAQLNAVISGLWQGGIAIANKASGRPENTGPAELVRCVDILLTLRTEEGQQEQTVRFGDFPLGISRTSPKYTQSTAEAVGLLNFLGENCPACELVVPGPPAPPAAEGTPAPAAAEEMPAPAAEETPASQPDASEGAAPAGTSPEADDPAGIQKYIKGMTQYIAACQTPWAIAFQGNAGSGEGMKLLAGSLEERYEGNLIRLHCKQLARSDLGEKLPMLLGASLISQLSGTNDGRVVKFAKASINLAVTMISKGRSDGKLLIDALFKDSPANTLDDFIRTFSELAAKKVSGEKDRVIVLLDDLDSLSPGKAVEVLEAMEDFFRCEKCVFIVAVDYAAVVRGVNERYGQDSNRGDAFFNKVFRNSLRLPTSNRQVEGFIKSRLEQIGLAADDAELGLYRRLLEYSTGTGTDSINQLFDAFQLLKTLAEDGLYEDRRRRQVLFGLLCMQTRFRAVYDQLAHVGGSVTPELLAELCSGTPAAAAQAGLSEEGQADFHAFAQVFCGMLAASDGEEGISEDDCGLLAQVLEFSSITSR